MNFQYISVTIFAQSGFPLLVASWCWHLFTHSVTIWLNDAGVCFLPLTGRYHFLSSSKVKGLGTYTAVIRGLGAFSLHYDANTGTVSLPIASTQRLLPSEGGGSVTFLSFDVTESTDTGIMFIITSQNPTEPISSFSVYGPGCCDVTARICTNACQETFKPLFLKRASGFKAIRTMVGGKGTGQTAYLPRSALPVAMIAAAAAFMMSSLILRHEW
jgi:hypothetical protein